MKIPPVGLRKRSGTVPQESLDRNKAASIGVGAEALYDRGSSSDRAGPRLWRRRGTAAIR